MTPPQGAAAEGTTDASPAARLHGVATGDVAFRLVLTLAALAIPVLLGFLVWELAEGSELAIGKFGFHFFATSTWDPVAGQFGALPLIFGTLLSSFLALLFAVPLSLGVAIFLTEFAPAAIRRPIAFLIELLAAIPSVVYGLWGFYFLIPILRKTAFPFLKSSLGFLPLFQGPIYGSSMLAAGLILAIMVMPFVMSVSREVLATVPGSQREAALALGATRWEAAWTAVVPYARSGLVGAVILGLGRALGETMAVTMVIGNRHEIASSLLAPGYTMAAAIANEFTEATTDMHFAALAYVALSLFGVTVVVNALARLLIWRVSRGQTSGGAGL
jgi:phosphate transport system permease protein